MILIVLGAALLLSQQTTSAQSGGSYDLTWNSIDGGGGMPAGSTGGTYSLGGTIGQADTGTMSGGAFSLAGGFWFDLTSIQTGAGGKIYLPFIAK